MYETLVLPKKLTVMVQDCPAPKLVGQLVVCANLLLVMVMLLMLSAVTPVFVSVTVLLGQLTRVQVKSNLPGTSFTTVPTPFRLTVCGLPGASSVTESVPARLSRAVGAKVTLMLQLAPAARLKPQLSVSPKLVVAAMPVMLSIAVP